MRIFEYPYVIITILAFFFILMVLVGLYFTMKSVKTAKGTADKSFCGMWKIESDYEKAVFMRKNRSVVYISLSLDSMQRLYSESKANRLYERIKRVLLCHFCLDIEGSISLCGKENFIAVTGFDSETMARHIDSCYEKISRILSAHGGVNVVRMHFGYHSTSSSEVPFKTALSRAKQACSMAEDGETLRCCWNSSNGKEFERKIKIENNIRNEIDNNRFFLEYQPILESCENRIVGAEVLSRLNSETDGVLKPYLFLSAVNSVGLNEKFDYYIFEKTCKWIASDKEKRSRCFYTINFSRQTLCDPDLADVVAKIIDEYDIAYSCIAIEILEDKDLSDYEKEVLVRNLICLKSKGVQFLLDDFGKGYTSFGDLTDFDINIVKIDKEITQNAVTPAGFLILKNIIRTAHDLGFKALCEGIETGEMKKIVTDAGCDLLQGYYFYRPMPVAKFETLFDKQ